MESDVPTTCLVWSNIEVVVVANVEAKKGEGGAKSQGMASDGGSHGLGLCWNTSYTSNPEYSVALSRNRS